MKRLGIILLACASCVAPSYAAQKQYADLVSEMNTLFASNTSGRITAANLRTVMQDILDSFIVSGTAYSPTSLALNNSPSVTQNFSGQALKFSFVNNCPAALTTGPEACAYDNIVSSVGAANPTTYFKAAHLFSATANVGSGSVWGTVTVANAGAGTGAIGVIGHEIDLNVGNQNYPTIPGSPYGASLFLTGTATNGAVANAGIIMAYGASGALWHYGMVGQYSSFDTAFIGDLSNSPISYQVTGSHTDGINMSGASFSRYAIFTPGFIIDSAGNLLSKSANFSGPITFAADGQYAIGSALMRASVVYAATFYGGAGVAGVTCATGAPSSSFSVSGGIVTHC